VDTRRLVALSAGGVAGASLRWAAVTAAPPGGGFPWSVFVVNVVGSAVLGAALAEDWRHPARRRFWHDAVGVGFCGGLTTFSTFAVELAAFLDAGRSGLAATYLGAAVVAGVGAALAGAAGLRRVAALRLPVEEAT